MRSEEKRREEKRCEEKRREVKIREEKRCEEKRLSLLLLPLTHHDVLHVVEVLPRRLQAAALVLDEAEIGLHFGYVIHLLIQPRIHSFELFHYRLQSTQYLRRVLDAYNVLRWGW